MVGIPLYSAWLIKQQSGLMPYWAAFAVIFSMYLMVFLFDLLLLDILMFCTWTPSFVVIPGTEGFAGYKDISLHLKGHARGFIGILVFAGLLALIPTFLYG